MTRNYQEYANALAKNISITELAKYDNGDSDFLNEVLHDLLLDMRTEKKCPVCGSPLYYSDMPEHDFVCADCEGYFDLAWLV